MSRHVNAVQLARYREDALRPGKAARIGRHLSGCAKCSAIDSDLAAVSVMLASVSVRPMPEQVASRLQLAIASEAAARAAQAPGLAGSASAAAPAGAGVPVPGRPDLPERSRSRPRWLRMPSLSSPLLLRGLAATAAVVVIAGARLSPIVPVPDRRSPW